MKNCLVIFYTFRLGVNRSCTTNEFCLFHMKDMQFVAVNVFCDGSVGTCTLSVSVHWEKSVESIVLQVYSKLSI